MVRLARYRRAVAPETGHPGMIVPVSENLDKARARYEKVTKEAQAAYDEQVAAARAQLDAATEQARKDYDDALQGVCDSE